MGNARRGLAVYFAGLIVGSLFFEWRIWRTGQPIEKVPALVLALMYAPAIASIIARLSLREGFGDVSFRFGGREGARAALIAWLYPIVVGIAAYGTAWITGLASFRPPLSPQSHLYAASPVVNLFRSLALTVSFGTAVSAVSAFGEELGWRGYMLTRLFDAGVPKPVLTSGVIWALWHVPLILSGQYASNGRPALSAAVFVGGVIADAYLAAYLRLRCGSIWPAVMLHAAWNAIIQGTFDRATIGMSWAVGESGILVVFASAVFVIVVTRGAWNLKRKPSESLQPV
jgi:membrane protease YdiL (CAAX protease family)